MVGRWNVLLGHGLFSAAFISVSGRVYHVYPTGKRWYPLHLAIFFPEEYGFLHQTANGGTPFRCRTHTIRIQGFWNGSMGIGFPRAWKFSWSMGWGFPSLDAGLRTCDFSKMLSQKAAKTHMMWFLHIGKCGIFLGFGVDFSVLMIPESKILLVSGSKKDVPPTFWTYKGCQCYQRCSVSPASDLFGLRTWHGRLFARLRYAIFVEIDWTSRFLAFSLSHLSRIFGGN